MGRHWGKRLLWGAGEGLVLVWVVSCGQLDAPAGAGGGASGSGGATAASGGSAGGSGGTVAGIGGTAAAPGAGGAVGSGSSGAVASGGGPGEVTIQPLGTGGLTIYGGGTGEGGADWGGSPSFGGSGATGQCEDIPLSVGSSPCADSDIVLDSGCTWGSYVFALPTTELETPSAPGLQVVLLPPAAFSGGGELYPGLTELTSSALDVTISPDTGGTDGPSGFQLLDRSAVLSVVLPGNEPSLEEFFASYADPLADPDGHPYRVIYVALLDGDEVAVLRRVILRPARSCFPG